jgi:hypothetical protein
VNHAAETVAFPALRFKGKLRPSQEDVVAIAKKKLAEGQKRLHIVAPPGSGKTVLGLYLWADCVKRPALVLSPNSAIQAQWAARTDLFEIASPPSDLISTDPQTPGLLTSLTYQSVTLPGRGNEDLDALALQLWSDKLIEKGQAKDADEARCWVDDLRRHNKSYFEQRLGTYRKQMRDLTAQGGQSLKTLHQSSLATLDRLRERGVGLIIFDECHHLLGHWGRVLADAHGLLEEPVVVGLTATPPDRDGKPPEDVERYDKFFGPIDYEVPVPAVVKDGYLAPYQDLAYFVRPAPDEIAYVANADEQLHELIEELCARTERPAVEESRAKPQAAVETGLPTTARSQVKLVRSDLDPVEVGVPASAGRIEDRLKPELQLPENLTDWLLKVLTAKRLATGVMKDWAAFQRRDEDFALAARVFLLVRGFELPEDVPPPEIDLEPDEVPEMETLVPILDRYVRHRLRRSEDSADHAKAERVIRRLRTLGIQITETGAQACASPVGRVMAYSRAKTEALAPILAAEHKVLGDALRAVIVADYEKTSAVTAEVDHLLDDEAGGAVAAFKAVLRAPEINMLDPILVTGSSVLIDADSAAKFDAAAQQWLAQRGFDVQLQFGQEEGFHAINGKGADWCPRVYVAMITDLFQQGLTRCLVGTRGLLGEGWDANKVNVLIDLTTVTTSMSVNQLRGRSIRLDPAEPNKLADNWDVICLAPEFSKGLDDYKRFIAKHKTLYGVTEDGAVEKGVGHVHAAFTEMRPEVVEGSIRVLNDAMLARVAEREPFRELWKIGEPYANQPVRALEARPLRDRDQGGFPPFAGRKKPWSAKSLSLAVGAAVLGALREAGLLASPSGRGQGEGSIHAGEREGGYVRLFLEEASEEENRLFTQALHEALGPLRRPRYVIPRDMDRVEQTWLSSVLPGFVGRFFEKRKRERVMLHAVPNLLAKNKDLAEVYQRHWNRHVSPGEPIYALGASGEALIQAARRQGQLPSGKIHEKDVFI